MTVRDLQSITESRTAFGYWWRYKHSRHELLETLDWAINIASIIACAEACKSGKTFVVASTRQPSPAVFVFACDHPDASKLSSSIVFELTPNGNCITRH